MIRTCTIILLAFCLTAVPGCVWSNHRASETRSLTAEHLADSAIHVRTFNGAVSIHADPALADVEIEAKVTCGGQTMAEAQSRLKQATVTVVRDTTRTLTISAQFPGGKQNGDGASFKIRLPGVRDADVAASNGSIKVGGLTGELSLDTSNGSITISGHEGAVDVRTSNGAVTATGVHGTTSVQTSNGSITVALTPDTAGPLRLKTSNGSITATVGPAFTGAISFNTSNGRVRVNDPDQLAGSKSLSKTSGSVRFEGEGDSWARTSNGSITLNVKHGD